MIVRDGGEAEGGKEIERMHGGEGLSRGGGRRGENFVQFDPMALVGDLREIRRPETTDGGEDGGVVSRRTCGPEGI